jgi:hypothetical protein
MQSQCHLTKTQIRENMQLALLEWTQNRMGITVSDAPLAALED